MLEQKQEKQNVQTYTAVEQTSRKAMSINDTGQIYKHIHLEKKTPVEKGRKAYQIKEQYVKNPCVIDMNY